MIPDPGARPGVWVDRVPRPRPRRSARSKAAGRAGEQARVGDPGRGGGAAEGRKVVAAATEMGGAREVGPAPKVGGTLRPRLRLSGKGRPTPTATPSSIRPYATPRQLWRGGCKRQLIPVPARKKRGRPESGDAQPDPLCGVVGTGSSGGDPCGRRVTRRQSDASVAGGGSAGVGSGGTCAAPGTDAPVTGDLVRGRWKSPGRPSSSTDPGP